MTALTDLIVAMGAPGLGAPAAVRWMSDWLPDAAQETLDRTALARIDSYRGDALDLHAPLAAMPPLARPMWYEVETTAQGGTRMVLGYGAVPMQDGIDIGWACHAPMLHRLIGPIGPARVTATGMSRPDGITDESWRELRGAASIVLRALLMGIGA